MYTSAAQCITMYTTRVRGERYIRRRVYETRNSVSYSKQSEYTYHTRRLCLLYRYMPLYTRAGIRTQRRTLCAKRLVCLFQRVWNWVKLTKFSARFVLCVLLPVCVLAVVAWYINTCSTMWRACMSIKYAKLRECSAVRSLTWSFCVFELGVELLRKLTRAGSIYEAMTLRGRNPLTRPNCVISEIRTRMIWQDTWARSIARDSRCFPPGLSQYVNAWRVWSTFWAGCRLWRERI